MCAPRFGGQADGVEMFVLGVALGSLVLVTERWTTEASSARRTSTDRRCRELTDAQALGYRAALGELPNR